MGQGLEVEQRFWGVETERDNSYAYQYYYFSCPSQTKLDFYIFISPAKHSPPHKKDVYLAVIIIMDSPKAQDDFEVNVLVFKYWHDK